VFKSNWWNHNTGHLYSIRLNTTFVRQRIPLEPRDAPVKVLLVSPFATNISASARAIIAKTKQDYVIEPEKIKQTLVITSTTKLLLI
jgi:hypothetical protein